MYSDVGLCVTEELQSSRMISIGEDRMDIAFSRNRNTAAKHGTKETRLQLENGWRTQVHLSIIPETHQISISLVNQLG